MQKHTTHARILALPSHESPAGGRLDALHEAPHGKRTDLLVNYHELQLSSPPTLVDCHGQPCEHVQGTYIPRCLRFIGAHIVQGMALCTYLNHLPPDHSTRSLTSALQWRSPQGQNYYLFGVQLAAHPTLLLAAHRCVTEKR